MESKSIRISAYVTEEVHDLFVKVIKKVTGDEPISDSYAIRLAIRAWAKQEKVK